MNSCGVRLWNFRALAVSIGLTLCGVHVPVSAQSAPINQAEHKLDTALRQKIKKIKRGQRHEPLRVIVRVKPKAIAQAQGMFKARGHAVRRFHRLFRTFVIDSRNIDELAQHPAIESISTDADLQADIDSPIVTNSLLSRTVGAPSSWTGAGIGVAVIDSGLEPSADFGARIPAFYDFTRGRIATAPYDDYGHGTHVAGLIGGSGVLSSGAYAGIAPNVRFVGLKVLNSTGGGRTSDVIDAIEFATMNRAALGIDVINLSLGHPPFERAATDPLVQAVEAAVRAGIVVVASAGNSGRNHVTGQIGYAGISSPGNAPSALTVGALLANCFDWVRARAAQAAELRGGS